jgi:acyl-CoA thioester hydrolase
MDNTAVFKNIIPIQVRFSDIDMLGHVSNTVYQNYYDSGKMNYFFEVLPDMDFVNIGVVGASVKIDYYKPIYMNTRILVKTRVAMIGNKSITMEHLLINEDTCDIMSSSSIVLVCYSIKERLSIPIPEHWKENILKYDENVIIK